MEKMGAAPNDDVLPEPLPETLSARASEDSKALLMLKGHSTLGGLAQGPPRLLPPAKQVVRSSLPSPSLYACRPCPFLRPVTRQQRGS